MRGVAGCSGSGLNGNAARLHVVGDVIADHPQPGPVGLRLCCDINIISLFSFQNSTSLPYLFHQWVEEQLAIAELTAVVFAEMTKGGEEGEGEGESVQCHPQLRAAGGCCGDARWDRPCCWCLSFSFCARLDLASFYCFDLVAASLCQAFWMWMEKEGE